MASLDLDGETLGEKRKNYNKLLKEAIANNETVTDFKLTESDVQNLFNVDLACHNRDMDYILGVFKCGDMLCVSRAISQSTWLITDQQYSNIINPEYIQKELFPHMSTKAFIKLHKHIRLNIKDEVRAEQFYLKEKKKSEAIKWLPYCSVTFIENNISEHLDHMNVRIWKRLCERTINIFEIVLENSKFYEKVRYSQAVLFLLKVDLDKYLDILEKDDFRSLPKFNDKATHVIMKKSPQRVIDKFDGYIRSIDIATFSKYLKPDEIFTFLCTQVKKDVTSPYHSVRSLFQYDSLKHFIRRLPKNEQFDFVKKVFIIKQNADIPDENLIEDTEPYYLRKLHEIVCNPSFVWYRFATFERAFEEISSMINKGLDYGDKNSLLEVLVSCTNNNIQHINTLLDYYLNTHKNEAHYNKFQFTTNLLTGTCIFKYDEKTWNKLNELFNALMIYNDEDQINIGYNKSLFVESIIIYKIIHDDKVPEVLDKRFTFKTLKEYAGKLNEEQKEKVFRYLYERLLGQLNKPIINEQDFNESINTTENALKLLKDWNKQLQDYPAVIDKIKEFIKIRNENSWKQSLSSIYNFNKSWRRYLFEESIVMHPSEAVCLNALKHDPRLLERYNKEVEALRINDAVSMQKLLVKLRTYWSHSLMQNWTEAYLENLNKTNDDGKKKASVRGLCTVLPQEPLLAIIEKYKPAQAKIDWNTVDDHVLNIQRMIAKNMHRARPQPPPDFILSYAKGDYLQFALPSLLAIFYNLNITESNIYIPILLDSPVSIQKHGIRFAYRKLDDKVISKIFLDCWKSSKNVSIRAIIFKFTYELLCNEKNPDKVVVLWELIEKFIDNLTFEEDKKIYELLTGVQKIPLSVRANYLMKSYKFMKKFIPNAKETDRDRYEFLSLQLTEHSREIMELLCPDFVVNLIQEYTDKIFFDSVDKYRYSTNGIIPVMSAYLLCSKYENVQMQKYEQIFVPLMKRALAKWDERRDGEFFVRSNFQYLLKHLRLDLKDFVVEKNMNIPLKMFINIQTELEKSLSLSQNYLLLTKWKLTVALTNLVDKSNPGSKNWVDIFKEIAPEFGKLCLQYLKEDVTLHMPCIYKLFAEALSTVLTLICDDEQLQIYKALLSDNDFVQGYLTTMQMNSGYLRYDILKEQILSHPSVEVKMHYYYLYGTESRYLG